MALAFPPVKVGRLFRKRAASVPTVSPREAAQGIPDNWYRLPVSKLANWGMVYTYRIEALSKSMLYPMLAVGFFAGYHLIVGVVGQYYPAVDSLPHLPVRMGLDATPPAWIASNLETDRKSYFDLGGGLRGDDALSWMASYRPSPVGMTAADLGALATAIKADLPKFGTATGKWQAVSKLSNQPQPASAKAAIATYGDRLNSGIVVLVDENGVVPVVSHVAGEWSVLLFKGSNCRTLLGPVPAGCADTRTPNGISKEARSVLSLIDPRKV